MRISGQQVYVSSNCVLKLQKTAAGNVSLKLPLPGYLNRNLCSHFGEENIFPQNSVSWECIEKDCYNSSSVFFSCCQNRQKQSELVFCSLEAPFIHSFLLYCSSIEGNTEAGELMDRSLVCHKARPSTHRQPAICIQSQRRKRESLIKEKYSSFHHIVFSKEQKQKQETLVLFFSSLIFFCIKFTCSSCTYI